MVWSARQRAAGSSEPGEDWRTSLNITMAPSAVNDGARSLEAIISRGTRDTIDGVVTTTGTSTAYVAASNRTLTAYHAGLELTLKFHVASGASPTLNVDSVAAANLVWPDGTAVAENDIPLDALGKVKYDGTSFQVLTVAQVPYLDPLTTQGDLVYRGASSTGRLAVGAANTVLRSDGTDAAWGQVASGNIAANAVNGTHIAMTSDAQGDVLYYDGTDYARLGAGTSGQFLQTQGAGANPQWAAAGVFNAVATDTIETIAGDTTHTFTHGLGETPALVVVYLVCTNTELGYSVGDRVVVTSHGADNTTDVNLTVIVNATTVRVATGLQIHLLNLSTKSWDAITFANWDFYIEAYAR